MVQEKLLMEDDSHLSLEPETLKNKTGSKSLSKEFIFKLNSVGLISYSLS